MKQHITIDQLQQLTPEQQERLREWWKPVENEVFWDFLYDMKSINRGLDMESIKPKALPVLSIGQCIELLTESNNVQCNATLERNYTDDGLLWFVAAKGGAEKPDLIDALWEAVKEVL